MICNRCKWEKALSDFYDRTRSKICKECYKKYYLENKEKIVKRLSWDKENIENTYKQIRDKFPWILDIQIKKMLESYTLTEIMNHWKFWEDHRFKCEDIYKLDYDYTLVY